MTEITRPRHRGLRHALGLCRREDTTVHMPSPSSTKSSLHSPSRLSTSSLDSSTSSASSHCGDKSSLSVSRKGVTYALDGAIVCCRFCDILRERDADFIYEDELVAVFRPLAPVTDSHVLVVPRCHIRNINTLTVDDTELLQHMREVAEFVLGHEYTRSTKAVNEAVCKFAFHTPPFNSIDHVHMHAFRTSDRPYGCLGLIKYKTDTWWCQSFDVVLSRVAAKPVPTESLTHSNHHHALIGAAVSTR